MNSDRQKIPTSSSFWVLLTLSCLVPLPPHFFLIQKIGSIGEDSPFNCWKVVNTTTSIHYFHRILWISMNCLCYGQLQKSDVNREVCDLLYITPYKVERDIIIIMMSIIWFNKYVLIKLYIVDIIIHRNDEVCKQRGRSLILTCYTFFEGYLVY